MIPIAIYMQATNQLFLLSDEHTRGALGCYGHPLVKTPNIDALAARGTRFTAAYSNSPLCATRASLATGRHTHETRCWDNGHPFEGGQRSWARRLRDAGQRAVSRQTPLSGFARRVQPSRCMCYGIGDLFGLLREKRRATPRFSGQKRRPGESNHTEYDRKITEAACRWLREEATKPADNPWTLFVSLVSPHFPLIAPPEFYALYPTSDVDWPIQYAPDERPSHPVIKALAGSWNYDDFFDEEKVRVARAAYYGLCSFLDDNIGKVLAALEDCGLTDNTRILYSSDHGEILGNRGLWSTSVMYEESVGIPMVLAGPDVPRGEIVNTPVSLVDCYPTIVEGAGLSLSPEEISLPGQSLIDIAEGAAPDRAVLSQYHAGGSITGFFMIRRDRWKYVHYVGYPPQLFDLASDPDELKDLADKPEAASVRADCEAMLREILDPEAVNALAFSDQAATIAKHGGAQAILERGHPGEHPIDRPLGVDTARVD